MKQRIITAICIILIVLLPVSLGGYWLEGLCLVVIGASAYEWMHVLPDYKTWPKFVLPFCLAFLIASRLVPDTYLFILYAIMVIVLWGLVVLVENFSLQSAFSCMTYCLIFSLVYRSIGMLQGAHQYLWTIAFATYGSDTGAYFVGRFFGKHKMNPRISPKKSWEGFVGGIVVGFLISIIVSYTYVSALDPVINTLLCIICPASAELGDLCFSAIKREYKVKDFSNLLPGHGGILDRVDSLLINLLIFGILFTIL